MRRALVALTLSLTIAACSPYDPPAAAEPTPSSTTAASTTDPCAPGDRPCWEAHKRHQADERAWWAEVRRQQIRERDWRRLLAHLAAQRTAYRSGQCGGSLPPCYVMMRESRGDIRIWNGGCYAPIGWRGKSPCGASSASGKWQAIRSSWGGYGGYVNAADAPEAVQDAWARRLYAGGRGGSHWGL